ncbi:MAG: ABC transporter permease, partial [Rhizobiaceae bacterium]
MSELTEMAETPADAPSGLVRRFIDSDLFYSFCRSPLTILAALVTLVLILAAVLAPWVAPHNPFDPAQIS